MALLLPEGIDVTYGPTQLVGKFILNGYEAARQLGIQLYWHEDMSELRQVNRRNLPTWYPLPAMFDPAFNLLDSENAAWIEARDQRGQTVSAVGLRYYDWDRTNLVEEMRSGRLFYDDPEADAR